MGRKLAMEAVPLKSRPTPTTAMARRTNKTIATDTMTAQASLSNKRMTNLMVSVGEEGRTLRRTSAAIETHRDLRTEVTASTLMDLLILIKTSRPGKSGKKRIEISGESRSRNSTDSKRHISRRWLGELRKDFTDRVWR